MSDQDVAERVAADDVVAMVLACSNIDCDARGWYALLVDNECGAEHVGRGRTAWESVREAHAARARARANKGV